MALTSGDFMRPAYVFWSGSFPMLKCYEGGSLNVRHGSPLVTDSTSGLNMAASGSAIDVIGVSIAQTGNTTSKTAYVNYIPMMVGTVWEVNICAAGHATLTLQSSDMYSGGELQYDSTFQVWGFIPAATSKNFYICGFKDATGTQHGRVYITPSTSGRADIWK